MTDDGRGFDMDCPTGNGLANIRDRIESVQGTVTIESRVGQGTTVRALIPTTARIQNATGTSSGIPTSPSPGSRSMTVSATGG